MQLVLLGRSIDRLSPVAKECSAAGRGVRCHQVDLAVPDQVQAVTTQIRDEFKGLNVLVHCAAAYHRGGWTDTPGAVLDDLYHTNVRGPYTLTQGLLPLLTASGGDVVFINSSVVRSSAATVGHYAATKHALTGLADSLRAEVNPLGVRVLSVYPGRTASPLQERIHREERAEYRPTELLQSADIARLVVACINLPQTAEVTDLHLRPMRPPT